MRASREFNHVGSDHEAASGTRRELLGWALGVMTGASVFTPLRAIQVAKKDRISAVPVTTLDQSVVLGEALSSGRPYRRLAQDAGWPLVVREELTGAASSRSKHRQILVAFAHLTDIHVVDAASPAHPAFLRQYPGTFAGADFTNAFRPQETLTGHVVDAMVRRINNLAAGPVSKRPFDFAITTGDDADSRAAHELKASLAALNGGTVAFNAAGGPYFGIQDNSTTVRADVYHAFWHPEPAPGVFGDDAWKREHGFPTVPGFLDAVSQPIKAPGLAMPWYGGFGNHDITLMGVMPDGSGPARFLEQLAPGDQLPLAVPPEMSVKAFLEAVTQAIDKELKELLQRMPRQTVPAAAARKSFTRQDFVRMHLDSAGCCGPVGHGFGQHNLEADTAYYEFPISSEILGIMLDSTNPNGGPDGSLDAEQAWWLEARLAEVHARYLNTEGRWVDTRNENRLVVLFSHHNSRTFDNLATAPSESRSNRLGSSAIESLIQRFPNVVLWVNGHTHTNRVWAHSDPSGRTGGFWEVNTAAHIDYPQQARAIELFDNNDGTLSIMGVMIDHSEADAVRHAPPYDATNLAALALELAANDPALDIGFRLGAPEDRNVELLVRKPF